MEHPRHRARVVRVEEESPRVKSLYLRLCCELEAEPGQFLMVWLPGYEEIPLSVSLLEGELVRITVAAVGETTQAMHRLRPGDTLIVRGPYGRPFRLGGRTLMIGGGYGVAPLAFAASRCGRGSVMLAGARTAEELILIDEVRERGLEVLVATDDGSAGHRGPVTDLLPAVDLGHFDALLACGPEAMMKRVLEFVVESGYGGLAQFSLERYIKCGLGICGSCSLGRYRVCTDGPVFTAEELLDTPFGRYRLDECGRPVPVDSQG